MNDHTKEKKALSDEDLDAVNGGFELTTLISKGSRKKKGTNQLVYRGGGYQTSDLVQYGGMEDGRLTMSNLVSDNTEEDTLISL